MRSSSTLWRAALSFSLVLTASAMARAQSSPTPVHPRLASVSPTWVVLQDDIDIVLDDPNKWLQTVEAKGLILYVNGYPLKNIKPRWRGEGSGRLSFTLARDNSSKAEWAALLARPSFAARPIEVQIGVDGQPPFPGSATLQLVTIDQTWFWTFALSFVLLFGLFIWLTMKSDVLREGVIAPAAPARRPFSLGRTQMAFWFFMVAASFIFIWMTTGAYDPLTPSVLALIGISAGTAMSAAIIDANKQGGIDNRSTALGQERRRLETDIQALGTAVQQTQAALAAALPGTDAGALQQQIIQKQAEIAAKNTRIAQINLESQSVATAVQPRASDGFLNDILSDENGVSFHRFQIAVWTIVLGIVFVYTVYDSLGMPDFDAKLLGLMGVSAGTYLGFKFPEGV